MQAVRNALAEGIGVFLLTFVGAGSILMDAHLHPGNVDLLFIALAHGLALSVAITCAANISGGHINPAVTIGLLVIGRETIAGAVPKILGQLLGGAVAGFALVSLFPANVVESTRLGTPALNMEFVTPATAVVLEGIGTFLLAFAVYGTAAGSQAPAKIGGFGIGLTVAAVIMAIGPLTGAALNPARHLGTAIAVPFLQDFWVYWVGPILGATLGFVTARFCLEKERA